MKAFEEISRLKSRTPLDRRGSQTGLDPVGYFWSHGYKKLGHNSQIFTTKKNGHKEGATRVDTIGGREWFKDWTP